MIRNIWTRNRARLLSSNWKSKQQETRETHEIIILIILSRFDNDFSPLSVPISNEFRGGARGRDRRLERRLRAECPWIGNGKREGERRYRYRIGKNALIYAGVVVYDEIYGAIHRAPSVSPRLGSTWTPPHCPHPPNIIGIDPYFPAAMRQPSRAAIFHSWPVISGVQIHLPCHREHLLFHSRRPWRGVAQSEPAVEISPGGRRERIDGVRMTNSHRNRHAGRRLFLSRSGNLERIRSDSKLFKRERKRKGEGIID